MVAEIRLHCPAVPPAEDRILNEAETSLTKEEVVSSEAEALILVDPRDQEIGFLDKSACHDGDGILHRAFSLFIFDLNGHLLLQQRAACKRLWPQFWSNSCCSHPRRGESMEEAIHRRLEQELGLTAALRFAYKFEYKAPFGNLGTEHELCSVYVGQTDAQPVINTTEVQDWRWSEQSALSAALATDPSRYTPWLKLEWARLSDEFAGMLPPST